MTKQELLNKYTQDDRIDSYSYEYKELGYSMGKEVILFADWNDWTSEEMNIIESFAEVEWLDEWTTCQECGGSVRISPNFYGWSPSYVVLNDCELVCLDCLMDYGIEEYLESLENNPSVAINDSLLSRIDLSDYGYTMLEDYSDNHSGLHRGMNDDPKEIYNKLKDDHKRILFVISEVSQFYIQFDVYAKE
ncbi:hypothetical protein HN682_03565 [Candidatus Peregrinibacteria bacterium]|jgi:hypothetical protein|nr:hypothetical protein [Candidatus Peregrinibacteria bacterium]